MIYKNFSDFFPNDGHNFANTIPHVNVTPRSFNVCPEQLLS